MVKRSAKRGDDAKEALAVGLGGFFRTLGNAIDLLGKLAEAGARHAQHHDEVALKGLGNEARAVYGFSIRTGLGGEDAGRVESFGNLHATQEGVVVDEVHEPLVDVFDEGGEIVVTAELPGAREEEITIEQRDAVLAVESHGERRYAKEILLPGAIDGETLQKKYNNGVLEVRARKAERKEADEGAARRDGDDQRRKCNEPPIRRVSR